MLLTRVTFRELELSSSLAAALDAALDFPIEISARASPTTQVPGGDTCVPPTLKRLRDESTQ